MHRRSFLKLSLLPAGLLLPARPAAGLQESDGFTGTQIMAGRVEVEYGDSEGRSAKELQLLHDGLLSSGLRYEA